MDEVQKEYAQQRHRRRRRRIKTKINSQQFKYSNNDLEMNAKKQKEKKIARSNGLRMKKIVALFIFVSYVYWICSLGPS